MNFFIKPKAGLKIRRPDTQRFLAPEGEDVPKNSFWMRRLAEGDIEVVEQKSAEPKKPDAPKAGGAK